MNAGRPIRLVHVTTSLDRGGAELVLLRLAERLDRRRFQSEVICLQEPGPVGRRLEAIGVTVSSLRLQGPGASPRGLRELRRRLASGAPPLVQTWLPHADLLGGLASRGLDRVAVAWGIRNGDLAPVALGRRTRAVVKLNAVLARWVPDVVVCCSESAAEAHRAVGFPAEKLVVIRNGFDLDAFRPDPLTRQSIREELCVPPETVLVGLVARWHPQKQHHLFIEAAATVAAERSDVNFVLCGDGVERSNSALMDAIARADLTTRVHLLGGREDIPRVTAALDVAVMASSGGEGFPNTVGEAMACGVPCVVTNVGDAAWMVGDNRCVVPIGSPSALAAAIASIVRLPSQERKALGQQARSRATRHFPLDRMVDEYQMLYEALSAKAKPCAA